MNTAYKAILILLLFESAATAVCAQEDEIRVQTAGVQHKDSATTYTRPNVLKTNLLGLYSLFYERQLQSKQSLQIGINRVDFGFLWNDTKYFSLSAAYRFYLSKKESTGRRPYPSGFYVSPYIRFVNARESGSGLFSHSKLSEVSYNLFGGGAVAGYQVIFRKGPTCDFFLGGGYLPAGSFKVIYSYDPGYKPDVNPEDYRLDIRVGVCIGFAFK